MKKYNLRVYALLINKEQILVSEENRAGICMRKFPGGGMEFGEGTLDALRREIKEELNLEVGDLEHFYTTDFFQASAFNQEQQLISIYYKVLDFNSEKIKTGAKELSTLKQGEEQVRWISLDALKVSDFTFPIDQQVAAMLLT